MARRRTIAIGPPTRGLTDFPERATPEHSTQALNVEFTGGGVATRRGTFEEANDFYTDSGGTARACTVKLVRGFRLGTSLSQMVVVGLVPTAGAEAAEERLIIRQKSGFVAGPPGGSTQLTAPTVATNNSPSSRWDACMIARRLVVCTDNDGLRAGGFTIPTSFATNDVGNMTPMSPFDAFIPNAPGGNMAPVNRTAWPYHQIALPGSPYSDDPGDYDTFASHSMQARFCRAHRGRLVLGRLGHPKLPGDFAEKQASIWVSNLLDVRGWRLENIHFPAGGDQGPVTGLAERADQLVVFRAGSVSLFRFDDPSRFGQFYRQVVSDRGCVAHSTIIDDVMGMTLFLGADGVYGFDGTRLHHLSEPIARTMQAAIEGAGGAMGGAHAVHYPKRRQVWFAIPAKGDAPFRIYVMDYGHGHEGRPAWSIFESQEAAWGDAGPRKLWGGFAVDERGVTVHGVSRDILGRPGYERMDSGDAIDQQGGGGQAGFRSAWESGPVGYGSGSVDRWRHIRPTIRPTMDSTATVTAWWRRDEDGFDGDGALLGQSVTFSPDRGDAAGVGLGAFVLGTDRLGGSEDHAKRLDVHSGGVGRTGRFGVRTAGAVREKFDVRQVRIDVIDKEARR